MLGVFGDKGSSLPYSQVVSLFKEEKVRSFVVKDDTIYLVLREAVNGKTSVSTPLANSENFRQEMWELLQAQTENGILESYDFVPVDKPSPFSYILPIVIAGLILIVIWVILAGRANSNNPLSNFGKARTTQGAGNKKVTFADVAGVDEEKAELQEVVDFLRNPEKFTAIGARIPHGILLAGPPGTGKTLLARAVAGEADVQFLSISGSDFMEMYVGVGASRVRDLFEQAKRMAPAIIFIDEIDAVGRKRGSGLGGGHDEREQTLNQLLVEMDGFASNEGVIVLAATNRADILDPALLRPGRFDRQIYVGLPDIKGREEILRVHARNKPLAEDVDLHTIAQATAGFTGADLENLLNEAALLTAREKRPFIQMELVHEAMLKVIAGPEKKSRVVPEHAKKLTAYHEAGHAVVIHELPSQDPVHQITIIPRGAAGGMTISLPEEDQMYQSKRELTDRIATLLGGRVAEELVLGDISTGASNDLERATAIARSMVTKYGMSDRLGAISYDSDQEVFIGRSMSQARSYSEEVAGEIDKEIKAILDANYQRCKEILSAHMEELERTAQYLLEFETMPAEDFALVFGPAEELEARKEAIRFQQQEKAQKDAEERARLQAEREAETARRLREADEALHGKKPGNPDPF
ncbi:MAG: ATP-dependent zinc metalloprotease FtsH [Ruminiclostridium sp.]|nr:ATP-dependent zinc metalloprotease FtsH [Ruminiclostridium sp.]